MLILFLKRISVIALGVAVGVILMTSYKTVINNSAAALLVPPPTDPDQLIIPKIQVDAPVKPVGVDAKGNIGVPSDAIHVAWYKNGPRPGASGVAVIDGHLDTKNSPHAVFYDLDQLQPGDAINVRTVTGQIIVFKVTAIRTLPYDAPTNDLFLTTSTLPQLDLITCAGDWVPAKKVYNQRLIVIAQAVR